MTTNSDKGAISSLLWMPRGHDVPGGHRVQADSTATALTELGVRAELHTGQLPNLTEWNVVHGFGLRAKEIHDARAGGRPVVLSTIYWDRSYRVNPRGRGVGLPMLKQTIGLIARSTVAAVKGASAFSDWATGVLTHENEILAAYEAADLLLPNSAGEAASIRRDLGVTTPMLVVPNAVSPERIGISKAEELERTNVLYVGRIDPHKNQLGLIKALRGTGLPLVILGHEHPDHREYAYLCRKAGEGWVEFIPGTYEVGPHYKRARVHAIPSWFETTGLVSLEAAVAGCNIVSTNRGHAREYLGDFAWYCDPSDQNAIRQSIFAAWEAPPQGALRDHVLNNFTWNHAARATLVGYQGVVRSRTD